MNLIVPAKKPRSYVFKSLVRRSGKDSREEAPQATTEHLVANIYSVCLLWGGYSVVVTLWWLVWVSTLWVSTLWWLLCGVYSGCLLWVSTLGVYSVC